MTNTITQASADWAAWVAGQPDEVLAIISHVQLKNHDKHGGYDVHISAWDVTGQEQVAMLASAVGASVDDGWQPKSDRTKRQWSLEAIHDGLSWHITATQDWAPGERPEPSE